MTENDFLEDLKANSPKDYAKSRQRKFVWREAALWEVDHQPFVLFLQQKAGEVAQRGVQIRFNFKLTDLSIVSEFDVITLVTHFNEQIGKVELADGMFTSQEVANQIPNNFKGIFDLTICHSIHLQEVIKKTHPQCLVIANKYPASFEFRLSFYKTVIDMISQLEKNYIDAIGDLRIQFIKDKNKSNNGQFQKYFARIRRFFTPRRRG